MGLGGFFLCYIMAICGGITIVCAQHGKTHGGKIKAILFGWRLILLTIWGKIIRKPYNPPLPPEPEKLHAKRNAAYKYRINKHIKKARKHLVKRISRPTKHR